MKKAVSLVLGNLVAFGFLVFLMNIVAIASIQIYNHWLHPLHYFEDSYLLPNYQGAEWARKHFIEFNDLDAQYVSYYGWRRLPYAGETINIDDRGLRRTYRDESVSAQRTVAFFGGSTTWGSGADDDRTIPSEFIKLNPDYIGYNFGESGYVAHQELNRFLERYFEGFRPEVVVFYDGANEVWSKCQYQAGAYSHSREAEIRRTLRDARAAEAERGATITESVLALVQPIRSLVDKAARLTSSEDWTSYYDCDEDAKKAAQIARVLLSDWLIVKNLVESYGGTFVAVLQPVAYFSDTKLDHLELSESLKRQYEAVYPPIVDMIGHEFPKLADNFLDLRHALDRDDYFYIDWCHVSPNGNKIIAARISENVAGRTGKTLAAY